MKIKQIADLKFYSNDLDKNLSIKEYLKTLLETLWEEKECFDGKRPFGNSSWDYDIIRCLIKNNVIEGTLDEDGNVDIYDSEDSDKIIMRVIKQM